MTIDEQHWTSYKDEFHSRVSDLLNYIQTISAHDISHIDVMSALINMRHKVTDAYLNIFNFVEDANLIFLEQLVSEAAKKQEG